jgi:ComF family protein
VLSGDSLFGARRVPIVAVGAYKGPLVRLILGKARKDRIAAYELGVLMAERISATSYRFDCIVPVPIHWSRILWRGYDQVFESAQALSAYHRRPLFQAVCRSRATPFQSQVPVEQRERNVRNAFVLTREADNLMGKSVLLVDDVYTTGATLKEVVRVLLRAQPREIIILVGARVVS